MRVRTVTSHQRDSFARLSAPLIRTLESNGVDPFQCIFSLAQNEKFVYCWPSPETILTNDLTIEVPGLVREVELKWISKSSLKQARRVIVKPLTWKDQMMCLEHADSLASGLILEQVRLIWADAVIEVHLSNGQKISLQVISSEPRSDSALILVQDTELEIEQPHSEPRVKPVKQDNPVLFSIIADPSVDHGFALFSLSDLIDQGWKTQSGKVLFKIQPLSKSIMEFGLVGRAGSGKRVKQGTIHVHPSIFQSDLLNTSYVKLSLADTEEIEMTNHVSFKVSLDCEDEGHLDFLNEFKCEPSLYILPAQLKKPNVVLAAKTPSPFIKMDKSCQVQLDYCLPPSKYVDQMKGSYPQEAELKRILDSMKYGLLLVKGELGSGKSRIASNFSEKHGAILFDFEPLLNNVGQTHLRLDEILGSLNLVPLTTPVFFDNVEWILMPDNLESLHEEERWALDKLSTKFVEFLKELVGQGRRAVVSLSRPVKEIQRLITDTLVLKQADKVEAPKYIFERPQISWNEFKGNTTAKATLEEAIIWPIKWSKLFKANNFPQFSAVLLYGPTGCGKTALMNSVISVLPDVHVLRVRGPELLSKYIGSSEEAVRKVFQEARQHRPSIILFDEIDSLAPRRGHDNTGVTDRVVNQLLTEIDGTGDREGIFIIGTTSRKDLIDPALLRSGRIDIHVPLSMPGLGERKEIVEFLTGSTDKSVLELAKRTEGMSPAQLKSLLYDAQLTTSDDSTKVLEIALNDLKIDAHNEPKFLEDPPKTYTKLKATLT